MKHTGAMAWVAGSGVAVIDEQDARRILKPTGQRDCIRFQKLMSFCEHWIVLFKKIQRCESERSCSVTVVGDV